MKLIKDSFDDILKYVIKIPGMSVGRGPGWILHQQKVWCDLCDKILRASGNTTYYREAFTPFKLHYNRKHKVIYVWHIETGDKIAVKV
jgi:hypothetical protein